MPYLPHWRMTTHFDLGPFGTPKEEATCTLNFDPDLTVWGGGAQAIADDSYADWATFMGDSAARVCSSVRLTGLKLYSIDASGHIDQDPVIADGDPVPGVASTGFHPWQVTNVVTLVAGVRGKGRFGRIYLPPQGFTVGADGLIDNAHRAEMWGAVQTLLGSLSNRPGLDTGFALCVAGKTGSGTLRPVTELRMGRVADTQRRRRRSLDEAYVTAAFSA